MNHQKAAASVKIIAKIVLFLLFIISFNLSFLKMDFFSDSDDEKAVEELLSQAAEMAVLEQVAAINCAGFNDSGLPSQLQTRFQKLKSFPSTTPKPSYLSSKSLNLSHSRQVGKDREVKSEEKTEKGEQKLEAIEGPESLNCSSPAKSPDFGVLSSSKKTPSLKIGKQGSESPSSSSFSSGSVSPPAKTGCFLCSPKKVSRKNNKENRGSGLGLQWAKHDEYFSDLSNFSTKSQRQLMKKSMVEEEKICREAEKIVKLAKQASARLNVFGVDDNLSDDENAKFR